MDKNLLAKMYELGANVVVVADETSRGFDARMMRDHREVYIEAKKGVKPTIGQIKLCDDLVDCGASFDLKEHHKDSMYEADLFIKENYHLLKKPLVGSVRAHSVNKMRRAQEITGLPLRASDDFIINTPPSDYGVPNH